MSIAEIYSGTQIPHNEVESAREAGLLIHHEVEYQTHSDDDGEWDEKIRDEIFAAHPEWVANYYRSGGIWGYS